MQELGVPHENMALLGWGRDSLTPGFQWVMFQSLSLQNVIKE